MAELNTLVIENAKVMYKNFSGNAFGEGGDRTVNIIIENPDDAMNLINAGWNVKSYIPEHDPESVIYHLPATISYKYADRYPTIYSVTSFQKVELTERTVGTLDHATIENIDIAIRPSRWAKNGNSGVKGYVEYLYARIKENPFEAKYASIPTFVARCEE